MRQIDRQLNILTDISIAIDKYRLIDRQIY